MKKIFTTLFLTSLVINSFAQRNIDLSVNFIKPELDTTVVINDLLNLSISIENIGNEDFTTSDTLRLYQIVDGDTMTFEPNQMKYINRTGLSIPSGQTYIHNFQYVFMNGTQNLNLDMCWSVIPVNSTNPIVESDLLNNYSCRFFTVTEFSTASVDQVKNEEYAVYPNPAQNITHIGVDVDDYVELISLDGKQAYSFKPVNQSFDVKDCLGGVYLMNFKVNNQLYTKKIVILN